jgi:hypothetical protein
MAQTSFPWENVDTSETQYSQLFRTLNDGVNGTTVGGELEVGPGFAGLSVEVAAGQAMVQGHFYISTAIEQLSLDTADGALDRIDTVVLRLDPVANSIVLAVVTGTPDASPVAPALTQTDPYGVYEFPLGDVLVEAASGVPGAITDRRDFMGTKVKTWSTAGRPTPNNRPLIGFNITTGRVEVYNTVLSAWEDVAPASINSVGDVSVTTPSAGQKLVFDGTNWVNLTGYVFVQTVYFTTSGTFSKADYPWLRAIRVKVQAGGASGGGAPATGAGQISFGGGGGGGGYAESFITDIAGLDASVTVTRGAGGAGSTSAGNDGVNSSFGALVVATGGNGGGFRGPVTPPSVNSGGGGGRITGSAGDLFVSGGPGGNGVGVGTSGNDRRGGPGGDSFLGGGGLSGSASQAGQQFGGGSSGENIGPNTSTGTSAAGANGIVIVELYA